MRLMIGALVVAAAIAPIAAVAQQPPSTKSVVTTITASPQDFVVKARLPGRIKASVIAEVRPQVSGIIRERLFEEGSEVVAGQPLYKIEDETYAALVAAAKATVAQAQANYDLAQIAARRAKELFDKKTGSAATLDNAVATRDAADAALQVAKAQFTSAEIDLDRTMIRAPITGTIGLSETTVGALVGAQQATRLATIRTLDPVFVDVTQSVNDLMRWNESQAKIQNESVTLILPGGTFAGPKGQMKAAEPQVEPTTGMVTLRVSFPNPDHRLLPGLYVEVELPKGTESGAFLVPQNAVFRDAQGKASVWLVEDGKVAVRGVTVLMASDNNWVITDGLKAGDAIITSGFQKAGPGAPVEVIQGSAGQAPDAAASTGAASPSEGH